MSSSLFFQLCSACFVRLSWMASEIGSRWSCSRYFVGWCLQDLFKTAHSILVWFLSSFFFVGFVSVHVVHPYSSMDTVTVWKKSHSILSDRLDLHMIDKLLIAFHAFAKPTSSSLSVDEMLLTSYVNFRGLALRVEMGTFKKKKIPKKAFMFSFHPSLALCLTKIMKASVDWYRRRVFANDPRDRGSIPGRVIPKTQKWYLMPPYSAL